MAQRRVPAPKGYITATRAKSILGNISDGMLRTYVTKGHIQRIVPETRSQGFYNVSDVERLASQLGINRTIRFMRGEVSDLAECDELLIKIFGTGHPDGTGRLVPANPMDRRATWVTKNPDSFFILRVGSSLVGCIFVLPLTQAKIRQILANEVTQPIYAEDIQIYEPGRSYHLYVMSACVYAADRSQSAKRFYGSRLIHGILTKLTSLGRQGVVLDSIVSRSETRDGIGLLKHVGFTEIETVTGVRNFLVRVAESGIPEILRYKAALSSYHLAQHPQGAAPLVAPSAPSRSVQPAHSELPPDLVGWRQYARDLGIHESTLNKAIASGRVPVVRGHWKVGRAIIEVALDERGRQVVKELYGSKDEQS
jgi:hypothetical protein